MQKLSTSMDLSISAVKAAMMLINPTMKFSPEDVPLAASGVPLNTDSLIIIYHPDDTFHAGYIARNFYLRKEQLISCPVLTPNTFCISWGKAGVVYSEAVGQSQISQFLGKMKSEDLVKTRKEAQTVFYQLKSPEAKKVVQALYDIYCGEC